MKKYLKSKKKTYIKNIKKKQTQNKGFFLENS